MSHQINNRISASIDKAVSCVDEILLIVKNMRRHSRRSEELLSNLTKEKELLSELSGYNVSLDEVSLGMSYADDYSSAAYKIKNNNKLLREKYINMKILLVFPKQVKTGISRLCEEYDKLADLFEEAYRYVLTKRSRSVADRLDGCWHGGVVYTDSSASMPSTYTVGSPGTGKSRFLERLKLRSWGRMKTVDKGVKASDINSGPAPQPSCSVQSASPVAKKDNIKNIYGDTRNKDTDSNVPTVDKVQFSAVAPERVTPGKYIPINLVVYEAEFRSVVDSIIESRGDNVTETQKGSKDVERNSRIRVELSSPDVTVDDDCPEQIWKGEYLDFEFAVRIPKDFCEEEILFTASVYINDVIATKLNLILDCNAETKQNIKITRRDIMSAFVSYASHDRFRVATVIQGMKLARPDMNIFFDIESLRSGQKWESSLMEEIDSRDVLYLCWSRAAKKSEWVEREWKYALNTKGEECIEPIPIDSPDICPPPEELYQKHFNDKMLFVIKATEPPELNGPCIIRFSTGEVTSLDKEITVMGKDPGRADLCVDNNSAVSRVHCKLVCRDGAYYITDEGSVNGTYVNGQKLPPNVETAIASESVIKLANEIFEIVY